ncbi:MAG: glycoside hydrolase family 3 N-terminal domain-containing protein, partial [Bacteroidota bacterium]
KWHSIINLVQDIATKETRLKIPIIYGIDAIHGANYITGATIFPQGLGMAATRNLKLMEKVGEITALETKASGIPWNFNPVLGVGREPRWSRLYETFGEDVYIVTEFGKAYIKGQQGNDVGTADKVATCMKHYLGYSIPLSGLDRTPAWIPERMLREIFLPPFEAAIKAGSPTVMINSGEINGIPVHSSKEILTDLLKEELGFEGFAVSDWEDIIKLHTQHKIASTQKEAVRIAVMAGIDMSMVPYDYSFYNLLIELVNEGSVPIERINDAVRRILKVKFLLGLFEDPYPQKSLVEKFASKSSTEINLQAAREAITLLENKNSLLPLNKNQQVLVTGPTANKLSPLNGGWTITWDGNNEELYPNDKKTILEAVQNKIGKENVFYVEGTDYSTDINTNEAVEIAENADIIILCLGEKTYTEGWGNIYDLRLEEVQRNLAKKLSKTGKPVVLVLTEGRPRIISDIVDSVDAIVMAYLPGMEGGTAIADVLFGDINPSGKLPISYPKHLSVFNTYDLKNIELSEDKKYDPQWGFGHGLSYTTFEYSNLSINKSEIGFGEDLRISVSVTNTGNRDGRESVELYISDLYASVSRPIKQLKGFEKIYLKAGETKIVEFKITSKDLSFIGRENKTIVEPGRFKITIDKLTIEYELN